MAAGVLGDNGATGFADPPALTHSVSETVADDASRLQMLLSSTQGPAGRTVKCLRSSSDSTQIFRPVLHEP